MGEQRAGERGGTATELATLGGGCFWCLEPLFRGLQGVEDVVVGYAGGITPNPTYREVCSGATGHAEVVQVTFRPAVISYREILEVFFAIHDPTTPNQQGADVGTQYRSIVLYHSEAQRQTALAARREVEQAGIWGAPLVTEVAPMEVFHAAEEYHQRYFERNPEQGYCRVVIEPKVAKFRQKFKHRLRGG